MKIARIRIRNFRCIKKAELFPLLYNVFLGPNNTGKTTILEALNLALNPEVTYRSHVIDENDFYQRHYQPLSLEIEADRNSDIPITQEETSPNELSANDVTTRSEEATSIYIEVILNDLTPEDEDRFWDNLIPWQAETSKIIESTAEGEDPFKNAKTAIRVFFEAWYDPEEDDFLYGTYFLRSEGMDRDECPKFTREHKRYIGFLIYRDFRALTRPITLDPATLFGLLLRSQDISPKHFEQVLESVQDILAPMATEAEFASILNSYKAEIERFLSLSTPNASALSFSLTDRTRSQIKDSAQLYVHDIIPLPIQKMGAGTRSLAILAMLTLIMRRRGRGILVLEEPETFLFPHAQRRVIDECIDLADQTFVTTHSPYVLERIPVEGVGRIERQSDGEVTWMPISTDSVKQINLYSKRLRQVHCEALVGTGVIIVEGDSDRWWLTGASRILNRKIWSHRRQEALELQGICVVSADTNGDIVKLGKFFCEAGLKVVGVFDQITDKGLLEQIISSPFPCIFLRQKGIEDLLATQLPIEALRLFLTEAPHCKSKLKTLEELNTMADEDIRSESRDQLIANKGSASMHEWIISLLDENTLPSPLGNIVDLVSAYVSGVCELGVCSLVV